MNIRILLAVSFLAITQMLNGTWDDESNHGVIDASAISAYAEDSKIDFDERLHIHRPCRCVQKENCIDYSSLVSSSLPLANVIQTVFLSMQQGPLSFNFCANPRAVGIFNKNLSFGTFVKNKKSISFSVPKTGPYIFSYGFSVTDLTTNVEVYLAKKGRKEKINCTKVNINKTGIISTLTLLNLKEDQEYALYFKANKPGSIHFENLTNNASVSAYLDLVFVEPGVITPIANNHRESEKTDLSPDEKLRLTLDPCKQIKSAPPIVKSALPIAGNPVILLTTGLPLNMWCQECPTPFSKCGQTTFTLPEKTPVPLFPAMFEFGFQTNGDFGFNEGFTCFSGRIYNVSEGYSNVIITPETTVEVYVAKITDPGTPVDLSTVKTLPQTIPVAQYSITLENNIEYNLYLRSPDGPCTIDFTVTPPYSGFAQFELQ